MQGLAVFAVALIMVIAGGRALADSPPSEAAAGQKKAEKKAGTRAGVERPFGREGDARKVNRVIKVDMSDTMRFFPSEIRVKRGDTIRFSLSNSGQVPHEMVLGTMDELKKEAELVKKNKPRDRNAAHAARVEPGASGRIVWQFTKTGEFHYACLAPGHFEAGMIGTIVVVR